MVRHILPRHKSSSGPVNGTAPSSTSESRKTYKTPSMKSRSHSPAPNAVGAHPNGALILKVQVHKGRNLAPKDKSGTSDPFLVLILGDVKQSTVSLPKTLNPEWNETLELPIAGPQNLLLEVVCWDKDRFKKDYMGEFAVPLDEIFTQQTLQPEAHWYALESRRSGKKKSVVSGEVFLEFTLCDPANPSTTPQHLLQKLNAIVGGSTELTDEDDLLDKAESLEDDLEDDDIDDDDAHDDDAGDSVGETPEKRRRRRRIARLKRRAKQRAYEFTGLSPVAGVLFLEISRITDLPPERNMTRTSFDMDPFVVTSLGKKTYRTKVMRHNLNPVYDEKLVFQVLRHETNYSLSFSVVDRDQFSGNDFIGTTSLPLETITSQCPEANPETGLYNLREPETSNMAVEARRSRFRLPLSRTSSATSIHKLNNKPPLEKQASQASLHPQAAQNAATQAAASTSVPADVTEAVTNLSLSHTDSKGPDDPELIPVALPLVLKNKDRWEAKHRPMLYIRAKYLPYQALRQQFWRAMLRQYDADDSGLMTKVELTTMLDTLGSTLHEPTIDGFFKRFNNHDANGEPALSYDEAVRCLEDFLQQAEEQNFKRKFMGHFPDDQDSVQPSTSEDPAAEVVEDKDQDVTTLKHPHHGLEGEEGQHLNAHDLSDDRGEEHVIEIRECPICHQPRLTKRSDADIITHIATCASQDWRQVNNIVMAGFVTSSQAQRKWYSKVITKIGYGGYRLGANSANILVQDRVTGQINEERMSVYVRLGIRLLYKGLGSRDMEKRRIRKLLRSLSFKQGRKYDDPASAAEIQTFINFHQLDMSEVLLSTDQFKNFNEFFYRALKPEARPCSAPTRPEIVTSPADCRSVVFNKISDAQKIWVKGREFSLERLLADKYPEDAKRYKGGALGIFRLAPQDYHRFHIPVDGIMGEPKLVDGEYYTVNPMAIRSALDVYGENIRVLVPIDSDKHGRVMVVCVGAMMVGSTVITRKTGERVRRAEELGYFKFGGSTILVLFEPGMMTWDQDLTDNSATALETLIRVGMSVGHSPGLAPHTPDMRKAQGDVTQHDKDEAKRRIEGSLAPDAGDKPSLATRMR